MGCWEDIEAGALDAMERVGPEMVEHLQELVSIPVVTAGPRSSPRIASRSSTGRSRKAYWQHIPMGVAPRLRNVIERSRPGEAPRLETGRLFHSIGQNVSAGQNIVILSITSEAPYKWTLQRDYDRPYISTTFNQFIPTLAERVLAAIRARA